MEALHAAMHLETRENSRTRPCRLSDGSVACGHAPCSLSINLRNINLSSINSTPCSPWYFLIPLINENGGSSTKTRMDHLSYCDWHLSIYLCVCDLVKRQHSILIILLIEKDATKSTGYFFLLRLCLDTKSLQKAKLKSTVALFVCMC